YLSAQEIVAHDKIAEKGYQFWLFTPPSITGTPDTKRQSKPLIVFLHGASLCGQNLSKVLNYGPLDAVRRGREIDAYIVAPQNPGGSWAPSKIMNVVEWLEKHHNTIDSNRIYVIGMSLGGYGTVDLTATYPNRIAAAMAMCGGGTVKDVSGLRNVPLWILHGTADRDVAIKHSDNLVASIKKHGEASRLIYTRLEKANHGHPARIFYMKKTYEWLFKHQLTDEGRPVNRQYNIDMTDIKNAYADIHRRDRSTVPVINSLSSNNKQKTKNSSFQPDIEDEKGTVYHTIRQGDNLWTLAKRNHTTVNKLLELNGINEKSPLQIGKKLRIK
ncbi:MAG: LysM peptidoglycan-binding domain-containing protein, partial [Bacteroidaceae bacterium]|nr:LysM peptidoglycan-binding domain-containing protein [Bacteroidaceae bacterium]